MFFQATLYTFLALPSNLNCFQQKIHLLELYLVNLLYPNTSQQLQVFIYVFIRKYVIPSAGLEESPEYVDKTPFINT